MARVVENNKGKLIAEFDSVQDVFFAIDKLGWVPKREKESDARASGDFWHFKSLAEARDVYQNHPERIREFYELDDKLKSIDSPGNDVLFDVTGDFLDVDRVMEGQPEVFGNVVMGNPRTLFATINVLTVKVSWTNKTFIQAQQKRILRLVDWLEGQGVRCQIVGVHDGAIASIRTVVKQFHDPVNLNDIAIICHSDWLRRIEFLILEQSKTWQWGYGNAQEFDQRMIRYNPAPEDGIYVYVGGYIPPSEASMEKQFDAIEDGIKELIDDGLSFNSKPLVVKGE